MQKEIFRVNGGNELFGKILCHSAKNAVLPLMSAGILSSGEVKIYDIPLISDVETMKNMMLELGLDVAVDGRVISISGNVSSVEISEKYANVMRSSMFMLGALLSTAKEVVLPNPGGCLIGARPLDIHLEGIKRLGGMVEQDNDKIVCTADNLIGADIILRYPSVGATENLMILATKAHGVTRIINSAREPEVESLGILLKRMGANISGLSTSVITIRGVDELGSANILPVPDRIVAGTMMIATATCGGEIEIGNCILKDNMKLKNLIESRHIKLIDKGGSVVVKSDGVMSAVDVQTQPYPLFPTDLQPQLMAGLCSARGTSVISETVFENRFHHAKEFAKMGANVAINGTKCVVKGTDLVSSTDLSANDLRGGAGILIAMAKAKGESLMSGVHFVDRGYECIEDMFSYLGSKVERITIDA